MLTVAGVTALSPVAPMGMGTAQAHEFNAESNITINKQGSRFFGKVASSRGKCKKNRNVTLVKKKRNGTRRVVGRDTTNRNGNWSIRTRKKGRFQAVVSARSRRYGHNHVCRGDRSATIRKKRRG